MREQPLTGGNFNHATRLGETVRRDAGPWTPAVHALLAHLDASGVLAPRPLGVDGDREVLAFIEGDTVTGWPDPFPAWVFGDECLDAAARLLRRYHDVSATFVVPAEAKWRAVIPVEHEVICHNDWAPYNAVFADQRPIAMLDWDMAAPGSRAWDLAYLAYRWVPLTSAHKLPAPREQGRRLRLACDAYGLEHRDELVPTLLRMLRFWPGFHEAQAAAGDAGSATIIGWGALETTRRDADRLERDRQLLERALGA